MHLRSRFGITIDHDLARISDHGLASCRSLRELTLSHTVSVADFYANGDIDVQKEKSQEFYGNLF